MEASALRQTVRAFTHPSSHVQTTLNSSTSVPVPRIAFGHEASGETTNISILVWATVASTIDDVVRSQNQKAASLTAPGHAIANPKKNNDIYVVDGQVVRKIDGRTGLVTVLIGSGALEPSLEAVNGKPERLALDVAGNILYISYSGESKILSYDLTESTKKEYSIPNRPVGIAVDNTSTFLYIVEPDAHKVVRLNLATGTLSDWLGSGRAGSQCGVGVPLAEVQLNGPLDVSIDDEGYLYVADTGNKRVLMVDGTQAMPIQGAVDGSTLSTSKLEKPVAVVVMQMNAVDRSLLIADEIAQRIWQVQLPSGIISVAAGGGASNSPVHDGTLPATGSQLNTPKALGRGTQVDGQVFDVLIGGERANNLKRLSLSASSRYVDAAAEPCPPGSFMPYKGGRKISECIPCPAGMYCQAAGQVMPSGRCDQSYFCPQGSSSPTEKKCPSNHYCGRDEDVNNVAANKSIGTTSRKDWVEPNRPENAVDGASRPDKGWLSKRTHDGSHGVEIELDAYYVISKYRIFSGDATGTNVARNFLILAWNEQAAQWLQASIPVENNDQVEVEGSIMDVYTNKAQVVFKQDQVFVAEIELYGTPLPGALSPVTCPPGSYQDEEGRAECKPCPAGYQCAGGTAQLKARYWLRLVHKASTVQEALLSTMRSLALLERLDTRQGWPLRPSARPALLESTVENEGWRERVENAPRGGFVASRRQGKLPMLTMVPTYDQRPMLACEWIQGHICWEGSWLAAPFAGDVNPDLDGSPVLLNGQCPKGFYCPQGTPFPQPCPKATYAAFEGAKDPSECTPCAPGYACPSKGDVVPCGSGYYCTGAADSAWPSDSIRGGICSPGHYCPEGSYREQPCPPGAFSSRGQVECTRCTAGYYCDTPTTAVVNQQCTAGYFCPEGSAYQRPCPLGTFSSDSGASACSLCTPRYYCDDVGRKSPSNLCEEGYVCGGGAIGSRPSNKIFVAGDSDRFGACPPGHYCVSGTDEPTPCSPGTYQDSGFASSCKPCVPGKYCGQAGLSRPSGDCAPGYYCLESAAVPNPTDGVTGGVCPAGWYCPAGSFAPKACPRGQYTDAAAQGECKLCPTGSACYSNSPQPSLCPPGQICPAGSSGGTTCPPGSYLNVGGDENIRHNVDFDCSPCPNGKYCRAGLIAGDCAPGYLCARGNAFAHPNALEGRADFYIPPDVSSSGNYQIINSDNWSSDQPLYGGIPCPPGHFCGGGVTKPEPCPKGSSRVAAGGRYSVDCSECPAGFYCPEALKPAPCPAGHYCPAGSRYPIPCPERHYSPAEKESEAGACRLCLAGYYCEAGHGALTSGSLCPAGFYCPTGTGTPYPCPAGTYAPSRGSKEPSHCVPCPAAHFCAQGSPQPTGECPSGTFCPQGTSVPQPCPAGFSCPAGATKPDSCPPSHYCPGVLGEALKCPLGTYCPVGAQFPELCPAGTFSNLVSAERNTVQGGCTLCPKGRFREHGASNVCRPCGAGHICYEGCSAMYPTDRVNEKGERCPPGHYCPQGSFEPVPCPAGTYNPYEGKGNISDCFSCTNGSVGTRTGQSSCSFCGGSSSTSPGGSLCQCIGANRVFQRSTRTCVCQTGYIYVENGIDLSDQDGKGDCQEQAYGECDYGEVRDPENNCTLADVLCNTQCGQQGGVYDANYQRCLCANMLTAEEVCDETCRRRAGSMIIHNGNLVFTDSYGVKTSVFSMETLEGDAQVLAGNAHCSPDSELGCKVTIQEVSEEGIRGLFAPPRDLEVIIKRRIGDGVSSRRTGSRHSLLRFPTMASLNPSVAYFDPLSAEHPSSNSGIMNPIQCITAGTTVAWLVRPGEGNIAAPRYPVYLKKVATNTVKDFDYGLFTKLKTDLLAGVKLLMFAYTFDKAGVYSFGLQENIFHYSLIKVVDGVDDICPPGFEYPQPQTQETLEALGISAAGTVHLAPAWTPISVAVVGVVAAITVAAIFSYFFRKYFWVFPIEAEKVTVTKRSLLQYVRDILLCRVNEEPEESGTDVPEDVDPRVFQAAYVELVNIQNCIADGLAAVIGEHHDRQRLLKDREITFRHGLGTFLRRIQDQTEELTSSQGSSRHRLGMAASLFLLRKDSLSEFVRSKRLTSQRETTNTGGSERPTAEWQPSSERADRIAKARLVSSANIGAEFKTAVKELSASLNGDWSSDELSSIRVCFKARVQDSPGIGEEYASAVGAMSDNHLTHFVKQIKRDAEHNMLEESLIQERAEFAKSRQEMIVETELTLMKESFEQNKKRIQCAANAYKSVVEAHNALGAILCSETNEAQSQAAYAGFAGKVVDVITEIEMVLGSCYDRIRNALHAQSKHLAAKLDDLCDNDERRLEQLLEQLELEEEAAAQFSCREESNRIEQAYLEFKRHWNLRLKLTFEARLCASLNALEEKAFPSLSLCTTAEEAAQIEATFVSEKQRATAELEEAFSRKEKDGLDAAESCFRSRMQLLQRRHRLEQQLRQKTHQRDKNKEVYISQTARQEALLVTEELLLCFSKFLKVNLRSSRVTRSLLPVHTTAAS
ncbi:putative GCC2 and GCC3 domain protein [Toxoplasma gondii CAST]|uniref:Putative GCC2 and GCC3 domain protein n=2 Tax=Toxoplasma gondii TaxID=5811 RepID=A0A425HQX4_TOXGO|nr:putative GCC2 and GCC3 domain protein [Toxoplasma gondii CAST]